MRSLDVAFVPRNNVGWSDLFGSGARRVSRADLLFYHMLPSDVVFVLGFSTYTAWSLGYSGESADSPSLDGQKSSPFLSCDKNEVARLLHSSWADSQSSRVLTDFPICVRY